MLSRFGWLGIASLIDSGQIARRCGRSFGWLGIASLIDSVARSAIISH